MLLLKELNGIHPISPIFHYHRVKIPFGMAIEDLELSMTGSMQIRING